MISKSSGTIISLMTLTEQKFLMKLHFEEEEGRREWAQIDLKARLLLTESFMVWLLWQNMFMQICR